ncbi:hypothetical protein BBO99_00008144 [Phytophthora kernoviae]|uniref:Uncharacterized protein n=2 Tax=Phytophthora kernoviae TaxID=325452 RepID=A0A3R7JVY5_9STRA|nr:hypothetical protein G195_009423 [Phytophthora kernoviae 00238/432]KAG2513564.1 hypothetical protein JM16_007916 [Phytophthora kernoviae]KAG2518230.1 hypothetical protein JM18_007764 [Phytophthora kernoviae]RLN38346.1 hypothetical protein BBI17_008098 [Phytophthora kernoviae]RLN75680.1 hypothetical protein BBO99_00008144 [Phytophthora kernoviae]
MVFTDPFEDNRAAVTTPKMAASVNKHYTSPFPPLQLSPASALELETLAQKFVARSIATYERFLIDDHCKPDENRWKFLSAKDGLRAYAEQPSADEANVGYDAETPITDLPVVMITGTMVGNLDDVMYGVMCNTTEAMRIKTSYIHDDLVSNGYGTASVWGITTYTRSNFPRHLYGNPLSEETAPSVSCFVSEIGT